MPHSSEHHPRILLQNISDIRAPGGGGVTGVDAYKAGFLLARSRHTAQSSDILVVSDETPVDFLDYVGSVTGQHPAIHRATIAEPFTTEQLLSGIGSEHGGNYRLAPYLQWPTVARHGLQTGIEMAYTPAELVMAGIIERANDKAYFREVAEELGIPQLPGQSIVDLRDPLHLAQAIEHAAYTYRGAFIQANKAGGGKGNLIVRPQEGRLVSKLGTDLHEDLPDWITAIAQAGSDKAIVSPLLTPEATHTVSGFIPQDGDPLIYGVFGQIVNEQYDYEGFEYPARDIFAQEHGNVMVDSTMSWLLKLQHLGYRGASDIDFVIGKNPVLGRQLAACESNTRENGFRSPMQHVGNILRVDPRSLDGLDPANSPSVMAHDAVPTGALSTTEIVDRLAGTVPLLGLTNEEQGVVVMLPPQGNKTALTVISDSPSGTKKMFEKAKSVLR